MDWSDDEFEFETRAIHAGQAPDPTTGAIITPLYLTSTYAHSTPGVHQGYDYTRSGNPTRRAFEDCVANLEGARFGFAMASGSVGTATIVHLLSAGDHVVACDDMYGGSYRLFERVFKQQGIEFSYVDMADPNNLAKAMRKNTRLVWVETPSNPLLKVVDIAKAAEVAHASGALLAVDNTFMSPYFQRPIALGADLVMHSTTKYINGHSDLVGGVLITDDEALAERLKFLSNAIGGIQSTFDAYMCLRSLKTLAVRMRAHESNALAVARFLESHPKIASVRFTGLPSHPQHDACESADDGSRRHADVQRCGRSRSDAPVPAVGARVRARGESRRRRIADRTPGDHDARELAAERARTARHRRQPGAAVGRHRSRGRSDSRPRPRAGGGMTPMIIDDIDLHIEEAGSIDRAALVPGMYLAWCVNLQLVAPKLEAVERPRRAAVAVSGTDARGVLPEGGARPLDRRSAVRAGQRVRGAPLRAVPHATTPLRCTTRRTTGIPTTRLHRH